MSSHENVVALPGYSVPDKKGEPIDEVVEILEELLGEAKNGNMRGVAIAYVIDDGSPSLLFGKRFYVEPGKASDLEASLNRLYRDYGRWRDE